MHVKIGPYIKWWGPYQVADLVFGLPEGKYDLITGEPLNWRTRWSERFGDWLAETKFADFCQWINNKRNRQVYVRIDDYDVWNMDETLRHIIGPMFVRLREIKHGYGFIEDEDVPEHLHSVHAPAEREYEWDCNAVNRYNWLLDEMIWAFNTDHETAKSVFWDHSAVDENSDITTQVRQLKVDREALDKYNARLQNAYRLFGKYYQTFWD